MRVARLYGPAMDPHAAWLLDRGVRTLDVRVRRHNENALALARWFEAQPRVRRSIYPGLESHPDHAVARELMAGFGGMLSLVLRGGGAAADRFMEALELAMAAPSLGGVETLVSQPRYTSHVGLTPGGARGPGDRRRLRADQRRGGERGGPAGRLRAGSRGVGVSARTGAWRVGRRRDRPGIRPGRSRRTASRYLPPMNG